MDWLDGQLTLPEGLGAVRSATVLETGQGITLLDDGRVLQKPKGGLHPAVATLRLVMN